MNTLHRLIGVAALLALAAACYDPNPTDPTPDVEGLLLQVAPGTAPADGETSVTVVVQVPSSARGDDRKVALTSTLGTFEGGTGSTLAVTANDEGRAVAELRAPSRPGLARVRSTVAGVIREDSVRFTAAPPERIDVEAGRFTLSVGLRNEVAVKTVLRRTLGKVTPGAVVSLSATRAATGEAIGHFSTPPPSDANGEVVARFTAGDTPYRGAVTITATHVPSGTSGSTQIQIVD